VRTTLAALLAPAFLALAACGGGGGGDDPQPTRSTATTTTATRTAPAQTSTGTPGAGGAGGEPPSPRAARAADWPLFGRTPDRANASDAPTGLSAASLRRLHRTVLHVPGTVDSSPIFLHDVRVRGARRDVFVVTTTYGRTMALDARDGARLWTFTPPGIGGWAGTAQITNASPAADPGRRSVFAASPNGLIHKLSLARGREAGGRWPVTITRDPTHEKLTSSFNVSGPLLVVATGGYIGDAPPYQGHVVTIDREGGRIGAVFNSLCSDRHRIIRPSTCPSSDSAIWARSGAVVQPRTRRLLVATGNAPWNGRTDWGDSVLVLSADARRLLGHWTPRDQAQLAATDADLGSTAPALLGGGLALQSGKDAKLRVLSLRRTLAAGARPVLGGEVQTLPAPGGQGMFTAPAVWRHGGRTTVFVTTAAGTAAYDVRDGRLARRWANGTAGTSPIVAGGLLYVQDPNGGLNAYRPATGRRVARLTTGAAHWQSPIVAGGRILVAEGDANDHATTGTLSLFRPR
jgi:outer membrane protein assembly factor BamB